MRFFVTDERGTVVETAPSLRVAREVAGFYTKQKGAEYRAVTEEDLERAGKAWLSSTSR